MFSKITSLFRKPPTPKMPLILDKIPDRNPNIFSIDIGGEYCGVDTRLAIARTFQKSLPPMIRQEAGATMDSDLTVADPSLKWDWQNNAGISQAIVDWYATFGFIGYQLCAMFSQHWLVRKCCSMPAKDAIRKGYDITVNNGDELSPEVKDAMRQLDKKYRLTKNMKEFITKGKIFGIRVCIFLVDSDDPNYYKKPFNINGVKPGSYRGMSQVDPYWMTPQPSAENTSNPESQYFYEPDWWQINGKLYHRTHLVIYREDDDELPDVLKPTYVYGGVSVPQKICSRIYAAERTADEAPLLALTKRTRVYKTDLSQAVAQGASFAQKIAKWVGFSNNYGVQVIGLDDEVQQFDLTLADLDNIIMTQYQLACASAGIVSTKLLETSPKGFNATGEFEESSYHEMLESLQAHDLTPLAERHYLLMIKSDILPKFGVNPEITVTWKPLDSMTAEEEAKVNNIKADTDVKLSQAGANAIDGNDIRNRIIADPNSGYSGIPNGAPESEDQPGDFNEEDGDESDSQNA